MGIVATLLLQLKMNSLLKFYMMIQRIIPNAIKRHSSANIVIQEVVSLAAYPMKIVKPTALTHSDVIGHIALQDV